MPNFTVTVTTTPKAIPSTLGRDRRQKLTLSLPAAATAEIYSGDIPNVSTSTGLPLYPGEERHYEGNAARKDYCVIVSSGTQTLRIEESE